MNHGHAATRRWKLIALAGAFLITLGTSAFYIDIAANFQFDFIEHHDDDFGISILIGVIFAFIGCIGWAKSSNKRRRAKMAGFVFIAPFAALLAGSPIGGANIHGPAAIVMMLTIPATVLAFVLLFMAALTPRKAALPPDNSIHR